MEPIQYETTEVRVGERRGHPRFHILMRVDITVAGSGETYWGSLRNLSRTGVAIYIWQNLKMNQKVTVRFHFLNAEGRGATEELTAEVVWQCGDIAGLEFTPSLAAGSTALKQARCLLTYLMEVENEAGQSTAKTQAQ